MSGLDFKNCLLLTVIKIYVCFVTLVNTKEFGNDETQDKDLGRWVSSNNSVESKILSIGFHSVSGCLKLPHINDTPPLIYRNLWTSTEISASGFPNGYKLDYFCLRGFPSNVSLVCSSGHWVWLNGLFCRPRLCPEPPLNIVNGQWRFDLTQELLGWRNAHPSVTKRIPLLRMESAKVMYECSTPGARLLGPAESSCVGVPGHSTLARWSEPLPVCFMHPQYCTPPHVMYASHIDCVTPYCDDFFNGSQVVIQCEPGFRLVGDRILKCYISPDRNGHRWLPHAPLCESYDTVNDKLKSRVSSGFLAGTNFPATIVIIVVSSCLAIVMAITVIAWFCRHCPIRTYTVPLPAHGAYTSSDCEALILPPHPPTYDEAVVSGSLGPATSAVSNSLGNTVPVVDTNLFTCMQQSIASIRERYTSTCMAPPTYQPSAFLHSVSDSLMAGCEPDAFGRHSVTLSGGQYVPLFNQSGSLETINVSDGTSVTLNTYESAGGSNPSLRSTLPQTGSFHHDDTYAC